LTPNLKLILDDNLTTDSRTNLLKIDTLGGSTLVDNTGNLRIRSKQDISILPNSNDIGGSGSGGTVNVGESGNNISVLDLFATSVSLNAANLLIESGSVRFTDGSNFVSFIKPASFPSGDVVFTVPNEDGTTGQVLQTNGAGVLSFVSTLTDSLSQNRVDIGNGSNVRTQVNSLLVGDILADVSTGLTIKAGVILDADINSAAAIDFSKMAALTMDKALISNGAGIATSSSVSATELGYLSGVTSSIQTQLNNTQAPIGSFKTDWITADGLTKVISHSLGTTDIIVQIFDKVNGETIQVDTQVRTDINTLSLTSSQAPGASGWRVLILEIL